MLRRGYIRYLFMFVGMLGLSAGTSHAQTVPAPSNLCGTAFRSDCINLSWEDNASTETQYIVFRRTGADSYVQLAAVPGNITGYQDATALPSTSYTYIVRARSDVGTSTYYSADSNEAAVATPAPEDFPPVQLPIEVLGASGTLGSARVNVPADRVSSITGIWMQVHGLSYKNKASVKVNGQTWVALSNDSVRVIGPGAAYGGIGGAFATLSVVLPLNAGAVVAGANTIRFRFNATDGVSMGFRVVSFNFVTATGEPVLPPSAFVKEEPGVWQPPFADKASIATGEKLWRTAALIDSPLKKLSVKARCGDCHARDGRDLKYFNFSNLSIVERAKFHGLSELQGQQIASYIRTRPIITPGRPWNPPYQPGPGLDSKPAMTWAAGAGIDWVLESDQDTFGYMFPNGITKEAVATSGYLNVREIPVSMQLPDWNHWLPRIHPKDAWGTEFTRSELLKRYNGEGTSSYTGPTMRGRFSNRNNFTNWLSSAMGKSEINTWRLRQYEFLKPKTESTSVVWTKLFSEKVYSTALWHLVKSWELMNEFNSQEYGSTYFGADAEPRTWFDQLSFMSSPYMLGIPDGKTGIGGSALTNEYFANVWYYMQLILNPGNKRAQGTSPIDWGYVWGKFSDLWRMNGLGDVARLTIYFVKGMQEWDNANGLGAPIGWDPMKVSVSMFVHPAKVRMWDGYSSDLKRQLMEALVGTWLDKSMQFLPDDYYAQGLASPTYIPLTNNGYDKAFGDRLWFMIPAFRDAGVDGALMNLTADWGATLFPQALWSSLKQ